LKSDHSVEIPKSCRFPITMHKDSEVMVRIF